MRKTIFHEDWWLDATAPGRWRESRVARGGRVMGYLRYAERMMGNMKICEMPPVTRVLGPVIAPDGAKNESRTRFNHTVLMELLETLASHDHIELTVDESCNDITAFQTAGCDVRVLPTLLLDCAPPVGELWEGLRDKTRNVVRRARERLNVREVSDVDAFTAFYIGNLGGEPSYFDVNVIRPIHAAVSARGQGKILAAIDSNGVVHAAVFFIWDESRLYYFLSTRDRATAEAGAVSLLLWSAIEMAHDLGLVFDFDGVTTESRFKFMAAFGGGHRSALHDLAHHVPFRRPAPVARHRQGHPQARLAAAAAARSRPVGRRPQGILPGLLTPPLTRRIVARQTGSRSTCA